jgi:hypothetical protein
VLDDVVVVDEVVVEVAAGAAGDEHAKISTAAAENRLKCARICAS